MSEWCQNKKCPEKKNKNQIRGSKGAKYYQSYKAQSYLGYWCSNWCRDQSHLHYLVDLGGWS